MYILMYKYTRRYIHMYTYIHICIKCTFTVCAVDLIGSLPGNI